MNRRIFDMAPRLDRWYFDFRFDIGFAHIPSSAEIQRERVKREEQVLREHKVKAENDQEKRTIRASDIPSGVF